MTTSERIAKIFHYYGLTVFSNSKATKVADFFTESEDIATFKYLAFKHGTTISKGENSGSPFEQWFLDYIFTNNYCRITDFERWKSTLHISDENLPFPTDYLLKLNLYAIAFRYDRVFSTEYVDTIEIARDMDKTVEQVYLDLVPSFALQRIFHEEEAFNLAEVVIENKIRVLDSIIDIPISRALINELMTCTKESLI